MEGFKKFCTFIRGLVGRAGAYFMFIFLFFAFFAKAVLKLDSFAYDTEFFGGTLLFSFILALVYLVLDMKIISSLAARIAIHYVLSTADFALVLCYLSGAAQNGKQILILTIFFTVLYALVMTAFYVLRSLFLKHENSGKAYQSQFTGKDEK